MAKEKMLQTTMVTPNNRKLVMFWRYFVKKQQANAYVINYLRQMSYIVNVALIYSIIVNVLQFHRTIKTIKASNESNPYVVKMVKMPLNSQMFFFVLWACVNVNNVQIHG